MAFSESVREEVKRRAAFQCCRCRQIGVEVHHIIPEKDGGTDDINNGAPLCPNCHISFGDNPVKRKEIRQMRDWWYRKVQEMFKVPGVDLGTLCEIDRKLNDIRNGVLSEMAELKSMLRELTDRFIDNISIDTAGEAVTGIVDMTFPGFRVEATGFSNLICPRCGIEVLVGSDNCPNCGAGFVKQGS